MSVHRWHFADETERRKWQEPEAILDDIGLKSGLTLIDIGCGEGFFTIPAARLVGASGKVIGVDIDDTAIQELRKRANTSGLSNIELTVGPAEDTLPCQSCADIIFLGNVLHDFNDPDRVLINARQMVKPEGKLVNLDWKKQIMSFGPPVEKRFTETTASQMIKSAGFRIEQTKDSGTYHYLIIARPVTT